ncbi:hypothetical protein CFP71_09950 [Amycolatopsis thailandensis]|uniref:Uncharacterized protein n=1 Tax=Amycolatopsis thailandensis TaxID=589330 RepID=A0A229SE90_9PSEU|nr:hypothetical protein [Amycolatopsis thailandensis]OXM57049.1 hypothetical protein CFP71_09950 [Amycolatopsis thailandensis]
MHYLALLPVSSSPLAGGEMLVELADWGWRNWLNFVLWFVLSTLLFTAVSVVIQLRVDRKRLTAADEHVWRDGFTEYSTIEFQTKLVELQWLLFQAYEHLEGRGGVVGNDGAVSIHFPSRFWTADTPGNLAVEITSSFFGDQRVTRFGSIDSALEDVRRWHRSEMKAS